MKKKRAGALVTVVITGLILIFASLCAYTLIQRNRAAARIVSAAPQGTAQGQAPAGNTAGGANASVGNQNAQNGQDGRVATTVRVTPVARDTIENSVVINGDVLAVNQVSVFPNAAGKITRTFFQVGDQVRQGAVVAMVDPSRPGQVYSQSPVVSPIGGTILSMPVHVGDTVSASTAVVVLGDLSGLMVETFVPERFSNAARRGLPAQVFLEAFPGETFPAFVEEVSPVLDPASRTLRIRLRFGSSGDAGTSSAAGASTTASSAAAGTSAGPDPRIKAGMFATVSLVTNTRRDVPVIPRGAVINTYGSWIVFTVDDRNIASRREISLGLENEEFIEVASGLEAGEVIVSAGQNFLSDGDLVRIVE